MGKGPWGKGPMGGTNSRGAAELGGQEHRHSGGPWASYLIPCVSSFLICKMGIIIKTCLPMKRIEQYM